MITLRAWFKDENKKKAIHLYQAMGDIFEERLNEINYLHVNLITMEQDNRTTLPEYPSKYEKDGYIHRVVVSINDGRCAPAQFFSTFLLAAEALKGFVEISIQGADFRTMEVSDPNRNETIYYTSREILEKYGIKVMTF